MQTHRFMKSEPGRGTSKTLLTVSLAILLVATASSVLADCPKVTVYNHTDSKVDVTWTAMGCYEPGASEEYACETKTINAQSHKSYSYNWGTTHQRVFVSPLKAEYKDQDFGLYHGYFQDYNEFNNAGCDEQYTIVYEGWVDQPDTPGYLFATHSADDTQCLQASGDLEDGTEVHLWDNCASGSPQKNRLWQYNPDTKHIVNALNQSYCLVKQWANEAAAGHPVHIWKCDFSTSANMEWQWHHAGPSSETHLLRLAANPELCMARDGDNKGDAIKLDNCDPYNHRQLWVLTMGTSGTD